MNHPKGYEKEQAELGAEAEAARKAANRKHRSQVMAESLDDMLSFGLSKQDCAILFDAIANGKIRHIKVHF